MGRRTNGAAPDRPSAAGTPDRARMDQNFRVSVAPPVEHLREEPLERRTVFTGKLLRLHLDTVRLPGGDRAEREVVEHPGAATVVAMAADLRVVLVRQWRHPAGRPLWELPAGTCNAGEDAAQTAQRELTEETGYTATSWRELGRAAVSPGYSTEEMLFFAASGLTPGEVSPDADEQIEVQLFSAGEVAQLVRRAEVDLKTLAGLALAGIPVIQAGDG